MLFNNFNIKLLAIDLDGTLLNSQREIPKENIQAIQRAKDAGIRVAICTGRPFRSMKFVIDELGMDDEEDIVCTYNGGLIVHTKSGEILHQETHGKEDAVLMKKVADQLHLPINMVDLERIYETPYPLNAPSVYQIERRGNSNDGGLLFENIQVEDMPADWRFNKMVMARPQAELDAAILNLPKDLYSKYNMFKTGPEFLEILPKNVHKGFAVEYLKNYMKLDKDQVMSIGDHENDLTLIKAAGFGVAMGNAIDEVKNAADFITKTNDEAGVAHAIDYVLSKMNN